MDTIKELLEILNFKKGLWAYNELASHNDIILIKINLLEIKGYLKYRIYIISKNKSKCFNLNLDFSAYKIRYQKRFNKNEKRIIDFIEKCILSGEKIWIS